MIRRRNVENTHTNPETQLPSEWAILTFLGVVVLVTATALLTLEYVFQALEITIIPSIILVSYIAGVDLVLAKRE